MFQQIRATRKAFLTAALAALAGTAHADITWQFTTTDGVNSITGELTTTGNPGDENTVGAVFDLVSIDSVSYNGTPVTSWAGGSTLPFVATSPADQIQVVSAGNAELEPGTGNSLQAVSDDLNFNFILLARPGVGVESDLLDSVPGVPGFEPTSTTFTVPPPPVMLVSNTTQGTMHSTLQDALDNATSGDAIAIAAGTLFEDNIVFPSGLDVTVTGAGMDQTFIDGGSDDSDIVMRIEGGQTSKTVLQSLSLTNQGGAALKIGTSTPEVRFVRFLNCSGTAALDIRDSALIDRCVFTGTSNAFENLYARSGSPVLLQCLFYSNDTFVDITRDSGPGSMRVVGCTLEGGNNAVFDGRPGGAMEISNSVLRTSLEFNTPGTTTVSHSLYPGAPASDGNIDGAPTFVDAAGGDYRLAPGSLGIDAADYDAYTDAGGGPFDLAGAWRRIDAGAPDAGSGSFTHLDMGAYETQALVSDCNTNGIDDADDLNAKGGFTDFESGAGHAYTLNGTSPVVDSGSVRLTEAGVLGQLATAIFDPQLDQPVEGFRASFDFRFGPGTGFGADGISFALLDDAVYGADALFDEAGPASDSLVVSIDTFPDQTISLIHNGSVIASVPSPVDLEDQQWHHLIVIVNEFGNAFVILVPYGQSGANLINAPVPGFTGYDALYGFGARTGADTNEQRVDNVRFESLRDNDVNTNGVPDDCESFPCNAADFAEPLGVLDFSDVLAFLTAFDAQDPTADLAPPAGVFDFSDVIAFLTAFGAGCP